MYIEQCCIYLCCNTVHYTRVYRTVLHILVLQHCSIYLCRNTVLYICVATLFYIPPNTVQHCSIHHQTRCNTVLYITKHGATLFYLLVTLMTFSVQQMNTTVMLQSSPQIHRCLMLNTFITQRNLQLSRVYMCSITNCTYGKIKLHDRCMCASETSQTQASF